VKRSLVAMSLVAFASLSAAAVADDAFNTPAPSSTEAAAAPVSASKGAMLIAANGSRLANVYKVGADGSAQIIIDGKLVTIPAGTLSISNGKLTTSLTKSEVLALH
jgi:hypothetical protein